MQEVIKLVSADGSHAPLDHEGSYDHRCDVYSFGVLLWEVMHVQIPFGDLGAVEAAVSAHSGVRPTIDLRGERLRFAPIIEACWSHEPDHRPALAEVARQFLQLENAGLGLGKAAVAAPGGMMPGMMPAAMPMAMAGAMSGGMPGQFAPMLPVMPGGHGAGGVPAPSGQPASPQATVPSWAGGDPNAMGGLPLWQQNGSMAYPPNGGGMRVAPMWYGDLGFPGNLAPSAAQSFGQPAPRGSGMHRGRSGGKGAGGPPAAQAPRASSQAAAASDAPASAAPEFAAPTPAENPPAAAATDDATRSVS